MFATGITLFAVGLGTGNPGLWIPGCALMAAGCFKTINCRDWREGTSVKASGRGQPD